VTSPARIGTEDTSREHVRVAHVDRASYRDWLWRHASSGARYSRLYAYDDFVARWPSLTDWFAAPLSQRTFDTDNPFTRSPRTRHAPWFLGPRARTPHPLG
jgi:hypothetical protein